MRNFRVSWMLLFSLTKQQVPDDQRGDVTSYQLKDVEVREPFASLNRNRGVDMSKVSILDYHRQLQASIQKQYEYHKFGTNRVE